MSKSHKGNKGAKGFIDFSTEELQLKLLCSASSFLQWIKGDLAAIIDVEVQRAQAAGIFFLMFLNRYLTKELRHKCLFLSKAL